MKSKIGHKLVIAIILFSSLITLGTTAVQLYLDYTADLQRITNYESLIKKSYLQSITTSVWLYDDRQIQTQLTGLLHLPDMEQLEITIDGDTSWTYGTLTSKRHLARDFPLLYSHKGKDIKIGTLHTVISLDAIYSRLVKKTLTILLGNALKTFLVSGFTLLIFQYHITRHLTSLSNWLRNLNIGTSFANFQLDRKQQPTQKDELDEVVSAINEMQDNLKNVFTDLTKSEKKYKLLIENIPLKIFHKDVQSVYIACNKKYADDLNIDPDQIAGKTDFDFFPQKLAEKYRANDQQIINSRKTLTFEEQYISPKGEQAIVQTIKTPVMNEADTVSGLLGAFIDITAIKKTEDALRESENRFGRLIRNLNETHFFYSYDREGTYSYISPSITDVLGYSEEEFLASHNDWLIHKPLNFLTNRSHDLTMKGGKPGPFEIEVRHKHGTIRHLQVIETPIVNADGEIIAIEGLAHDITTSKRMENQLRQAQKMESIGTLAGGIAHDFNNILAIILGYSELAWDDAPPGSAFSGDIKNIIEAGNRAKDLVQQILSFSRQTQIERIPIQIQSLVKEAIKMLRASIPTTIEIQDNIDSKCGTILADPTQIHQILMNLCTNANHAMQESGGIMKIELKPVSVTEESFPSETVIMPGDYNELTISDTGCGMSTETIDKIFDPYFTTKETGKGTGLGLAIVHGIITDYGGAITVSSKPGMGSTFRLFFPVIKQVEFKITETNEETVYRGKGRILFVDDEELLGTMGQTMLERLGYSVTVSSNSLEALATFKDQPHAFDLVITDQTMPGITGSELAKRMLLIRPDISIILCTGFSNLIDEESAKAIGIKAFALKPLTKASLASLLKKVLNNN